MLDYINQLISDMSEEFKKLNDEYACLQWYKLELRTQINDADKRMHKIKKKLKELSK